MKSRHPSCRTSSYSSKSTGMAARSKAYETVLREGGTHKQAVQSYVAGNKWATENAKAVGNI